MSVSVDRALEIAKQHLGTDRVELFETSDLYIAGPAYEQGEDRPGDLTIAISKANGSVRTVFLPSDEGFELIDKAKPVRITSKSRSKKNDGQRSAEEMARRGREDGKAVRVISVPKAQMAVTYEEALRIAVSCWAEVDYVTEYEDAFVFSRYDDMSFGGNSPVVVMKATGETINFVAYLDSGRVGNPIREGYITTL